MTKAKPPIQNNLNLSFNPHPLARNTHFQTIASSFIKVKAPHLLAASREMILNAGDGVRLQGFYSPQPEGKSRGLILLLHGWLGQANAVYVLATGEHLYRQGYSIFRLHFRDHGGTFHLNSGIFRSDLLDEAFSATQQIAALEPARPFHIIGASLGGSFALRLAWRHTQTPVPNMAQTIAINPSVNPYHTTLALDTSFFVYLAYFRRKWRRMFRNKKAAFPDLYPDIAAILAAPTTMTMTEAFTSFGPYATALDYLNSYAVTPQMMSELQSNVTIITAADDPIVPVADFAPFVGVSPWLHLAIQPYGGHVGFIDIFPLRHWLSEAATAILANSEF